MLTGENVFVSSTPIRQESADQFVVGSPDLSNPPSFMLDDTDFEYLEHIKNRPKRVVYSDEESLSRIRNDQPVSFKPRSLKCVKYVDDCLFLERVSYTGAERFNMDGEVIALTKASQSENVFRTVENNAAKRGMQINNKKTRMLSISAANSYVASSYLVTTDGMKILTTREKMRVLGFYFSTEPNVKENMRLVQKKFKCRVWALRHLKRNGFCQADLVKVYTTMIRPVSEYCSSVYNSLITQSDSNELEKIQMQALKGIYG